MTSPSADPVADEATSVPAEEQPGLLAALVEDVSELGGGLQAAFEPGAGSESEAEEDHDFGGLDLSDLLLETSLKAAARAEVERALAQFLSPQRVLLRDKLTMVLFTLHLVVGAYWLGCSPQTFHRLYTAEGILLLVLRWTHYRWTRQHYYLLDWCYVANALLVLNVWHLPTNVLLFKINFAHAMGPLLWSILAFRNSIVFHSTDKMSSHFMHFFPACVCWSVRWHPAGPLAEALAADADARARWESAGVRDLMLLPMLPYVLWAALYYLKVFVISSKKIQQRGYDTLFKYSTASRRSLFGAIVLRFPTGLQPLVYMAVHLSLTLVTLGLGTLWWSSFGANTAFMLCIFTASAWSGATFYFDVFAHRYVSSVGIKRRHRGSATPPHSQQSGPATVSTAGTLRRR